MSRRKNETREQYNDTNKTKKLRLSYLGCQSRLNEWLYSIIADRVDNFQSFLDNPAGSGTNSYYMAQQDKHVHSNDLSMYSISIVHALLQEPEIEMPESSMKTGWLTETNKLNFPVDVCQTVDYLCGIPNYTIKACVGRWLLKNTFRSMSWDKKRISTSTVDDLWKSVSRNLNYFNSLKINKDSNTNSTVYNEDWLDVLEKINNVDVIYSDFAWPWKNTKQPAYGLVFADIDSILRQGPSRINEFRYDDVWKRLNKYIIRAKKKCKLLVISSQTSNYPPMNELESFLEKYGSVEHIKKEFVGLRSGNTFGEHMFIQKGEK